MSEKTLKTRIIHKNGSEEDFAKATNFIPKQAELVILNPDENNSYARLKVGDNEHVVSDLPVLNAQSDWSVNDSSNPSYVQNRTHYAEMGTTVALDESELAVTLNNGYYGTETAFNSPLVVGTTYNVTVDGTTGSSTAIEIDPYVIVGNAAILDAVLNSKATIATEYPDTGENYAVVYVPDYDEGMFITSVEGDSHAVTVSTYGEIVHKLDAKYLPDFITEDELTEFGDMIYSDVSSNIATNISNAPHVKYESQTLTSAQQTIARGNINAASDSEVVKFTTQSLSSTQKAQAVKNIGLGSFTGAYDSLTGKPTIYDDVVRYGEAQTLTTTQKETARGNIGASDFSGDYGDLTNAPAYDSSTDTITVKNVSVTNNVNTKSLVVSSTVNSNEGQVARTAKYFSSGINYYPDGTDSLTSPYAAIAFASRDDEIVINPYYNTVIDGVISTQDIIITGIAEPTKDNDVANKSYVDKISDKLNTEILQRVDNKVDKVEGKGLSENDFTTTEKDKLATVAEGAEPNVQSDWNENDENDPAFIKNRPFYSTDPVETTIVEEQTLEGFSKGTYQTNATNIELIEGQTYDVVWDGTTYSDLVCYIVEGFNAIGAHFKENSGFDFTTCPFVIIYMSSYQALMIQTDSTETSHTIKIISAISEVIQLPEKYISYKPGIKTTGTIYAITAKDQDTGENVKTEVVAGIGAEIFNDYVSNIASGNYSHAEGHNTTASGNYSHAEGHNTTASGDCSHTEGEYSKASGDYSHAEGSNTTVSGNFSHAEGCNTRVSGNFSHAEGSSTIAAGHEQHVQGKYNIEDTENKYVHIVGNGDRDVRSNAHTLDWEGNAEYQGDVIAYGCESGQTPISLKELDKTKTMIVTLSEAQPATASEDPEVAPLGVGFPPVADKTYEEIIEHINNGGTVSLYDLTTGIIANDCQIETDLIVFLYSYSLDNNGITIRSGNNPSLNTYTMVYQISSDNSITVFDSEYNLAESEEPMLNTDNKTVLGAINELNTNKAETSQLPMILTLSFSDATTASEDDGISEQQLFNSYKVDKTFEEIKAHIDNGGTVALYDPIVMEGYTTSTYIVFDEAIAFELSLNFDYNNIQTLSDYTPNSLYTRYVGYYISSDNSVTVGTSIFDINKSKNPRLNTTDKTITGSINELNTNKAETSQLPMIITLSENEETTTTSEDDGISAQDGIAPYKIDKTFDEIKAHIDNGGAVALYDSIVMTGFTISTHIISDEAIIFTLSLSANNNDHQPLGVITSSLRIQTILYIILQDSSIMIQQSTFDINESENPGLNTTNKAIVGSINEVNTNLYSLAEVVNVKPDWNENDESSHAYIENRPFYEEATEENCYEGELAFSEFYGGAYVGNLYDSSTCEFYIKDMAENEILIVTFDDVQYEVVVKKDETLGNYAGNVTIMTTVMTNAGKTDVQDYEDTGEPFYIDGGMLMLVLSSESSHNVTIIRKTSNIKSLESKYLSIPIREVITEDSSRGNSLIMNDIINNIASGSKSIASGYHSIASGIISFAHGDYVTASGQCAFAVGFDNEAAGEYSFVTGSRNTASGENAFAEGFSTKASSDYQHVQGKYNIEDSENKYGHIVGNGTSNTARSNAHTLDWSGNAEFAGDVVANGCGGESPISLVETAAKTVMVVQVTQQYTDDGITYSSDKTFSEISEHVNSGGSILLFYNDGVNGNPVYQLDTLNSNQAVFKRIYSNPNNISVYYLYINNDDSISTEFKSIRNLQLIDLNTTDKTLVGAINELLATITDLQAEVAELKATYVDLTEDDANALVEEVFG